MPELPEVETIKKGLEKTIVGKKIANVKVLREKSFKGNPKEIVGKYVVSVGRRAKLLIIGLNNKKLNCSIFLLIHLKMTGQIIVSSKLPAEVSQRRPASCLGWSASGGKTQNSKLEKKRSPYDVDGLPNKYTRVVINFDDGSTLFFNDLRVFGWMKLVKVKSQKSKVKTIDQIVGEKLGPEPFSAQFTVDYLKEVLNRWGRPIKLLLIDQTKIAGVGNIYANEALFCAGVAPQHRGKDLVKAHPEKIKKLYDCILKVLKLGIKYGGSTASDDAFRNIEGRRGQMQKHFMVYGQEGKDCPNKCGHKIRRRKLGGRGTFFCPRCQR